MARIRTIKPEFWTDSILVTLPVVTRLFYIGLWNYADDQGCFWNEPERMEMAIMPREREFSAQEQLDLLEACGRITFHVNDDGSTFYQVAHWEHQKIDHPSAPKIIRESSRKLAIPQQSRRDLAVKYGCPPGEPRHPATCYYCGAPGFIHWHLNHVSGKPSAWVTFVGLQIDHFVPENSGGSADSDNLVLACERCNKSKRSCSPMEFLAESSRVLANPSVVSVPVSVPVPVFDLIPNGIGMAEAKPAPKEDKSLELAGEMIDYLNKVCNRSFTVGSGGAKALRARCKTAKTDVALMAMRVACKHIVDYKFAEWGADPNMRQYLRPETLFSNEHWESYLHAAMDWDSRGRPPIRKHMNGVVPQKSMRETDGELTREIMARRASNGN